MTGKGHAGFKKDAFKSHLTAPQRKQKHKMEPEEQKNMEEEMKGTLDIIIFKFRI